MKKKRVTIIAWRDLWNPDMGGAEIYITKMAEFIAARGHKVRFLTPKYPGSKGFERIRKISYIRPHGKYSSYILYPLIFLFKFRKDTDIVIENYNAWPYLTPLLHKRSLIAFMHLQDREWHDHFPKVVAWLFGPLFKYSSRFLLQLFYKNRNMVSISPSSSESIDRLKLRPKRLEIIYPGVDNERLIGEEGISLKSASLKGADLNLFYVGRLSEHKRVEIAIDLVKRFVDSGVTDVELHIAGKGAQEAVLMDLVKEYQIQDHVKFHGFISEEEKYQLYDKAHIHIQPAQYEGWGITVIEAAGRGTPSLAFNVEGLRDSIGGSGYIVEDVDELFLTAMRIKSEITQPDSEYWRKVGAAPDWARRFTWDSQCIKFNHLVEELVSSGSQQGLPRSN